LRWFFDKEEPGVRTSTQQRKIRKNNITINFTFLQHHPQEPEATEQGISNKKRDREKVKMTIGFSFPSNRGEKGKKLEEQ
jgi:hypothetical protein